VSRSGLKGKSTEKFNKSENVSLTSLGPAEIEMPGSIEGKKLPVRKGSEDESQFTRRSCQSEPDKVLGRMF
jgi:hypothetical protein